MFEDKEIVWTFEWAQHKEGCQSWYLALINCFTCGAKGKVNV
jgi:hypothetical protein